MATKPFLPVRWWEWGLTIILLAFLAAIFLPPCISMGPTFGPSVVAQNIKNSRLETGRWPKAGEPIGVNHRFKDRAYAYDLRQAGTGAAMYRIVVDDRDELWRIPILGDRPKRLARF